MSGQNKFDNITLIRQITQCDMKAMAYSSRDSAYNMFAAIKLCGNLCFVMTYGDE
jgi:hypothetical protein